MEKDVKKDIYVWLNHLAVHLTLTKHCKLNIIFYAKKQGEQGERKRLAEITKGKNI